ncbi:MAG: inositol monophosphatase family protein [Nitrospirales bacterium]
MGQLDIPDQMDLSELLQIAVAAAQEPTKIILDYFEQTTLVIERKSDHSPVTEADREAERRIREKLMQHVSSDPIDILGEEHGSMGTESRFRWTVDPIDGTRSFVRGIPLFGTIVALEDRVAKQALVGVIHLPVLKTTYSAARGLGSWCNERRVNISSIGALDQAIVSLGDPLQFAHAKCEEMYGWLTKKCSCVRGYTDCFGHALVASGSLDVMLDPDLNPWDVLATQVLIEEAGGMMLMRPSANEGKSDALFGNPDLVMLLSHELKF